MVDPLGRVPGPTGSSVPVTMGKILGYLRDRTTTVNTKDAVEIAFNVDHVKSEIVDIMNRINYSEGGGNPQPGEASNRDPANGTLPGFREGGSRRDIKTPGISLTSKSFKMTAVELDLSKDDKSLDFIGDGKATLEIPTDFPSNFDTPTDIPIHLTMVRLGASEISLSGYAQAYHVVRANYQLNVPFNPRLLICILIKVAKHRNVRKADVEEMLSNMSFDFPSLIKAGPVPLTFIKMAADSLLPLKHPLIGATNDLIPVQAAALPGHDFFMGGLLLVPKGVFFPFNARGLGAHYSHFRRNRGLSITGAGLAIPNLSEFTNPSLFACFDVGYSARVTDSLDLKVGLTHTFSPSSSSGQPDSIQYKTMQAESKPWLPVSSENLPPDQNLSGQNVMVTAKCVFDWL